MSYATPRALRTALEHRLLLRSNETGAALDRLRRRVVFERVMARLEIAEPGRWVLKGGMALEVRLQDRSRLTKDLDLGLRDDVGAEDLHERLIDALAADTHGDRFVFTATVPVPLAEDQRGDTTWRVRVVATLADTTFGRIQLDISPRPHELITTDRVELPNSLDFADVPPTVVEVIDINRHAAEKLHAMTRDYGDRDNSRVRDLVDLVLLIENALLTPTDLVAAAQQVWAEREGTDPPARIPPLPESWLSRYERLATDHELQSLTFPAAVALIEDLWRAMFPNEET